MVVWVELVVEILKDHVKVLLRRGLEEVWRDLVFRLGFKVVCCQVFEDFPCDVREEGAVAERAGVLGDPSSVDNVAAEEAVTGGDLRASRAGVAAGAAYRRGRLLLLLVLRG